MEDSRTVALYWQKNADAIKETARKHGAYCFTITDNIRHNKVYIKGCFLSVKKIAHGLKQRSIVP